MDVILQDLPFLHPLAVHFPIAFVSGALLGLIVWAVTGRRLWRFFILAMLALGFLGGAAAYVTGTSMPIEAASDLSAIHVTSAGAGFILTGIALVVLVAINFYLERRTTLRRHPPDPPLTRVIVGLLVMAAWISMAVAAYSGHLLAVS